MMVRIGVAVPKRAMKCYFFQIYTIYVVPSANLKWPAWKLKLSMGSMGWFSIARFNYQKAFMYMYMYHITYLYLSISILAHAIHCSGIYTIVFAVYKDINPFSGAVTGCVNVCSPKCRRTGFFQSKISKKKCIQLEKETQWVTLWWTNIGMENGHRNSGFSQL